MAEEETFNKGMEVLSDQTLAGIVDSIDNDEYDKQAKSAAAVEHVIIQRLQS